MTCLFLLVDSKQFGDSVVGTSKQLAHDCVTMTRVTVSQTCCHVDSVKSDSDSGLLLC